MFEQLTNKGQQTCRTTELKGAAELAEEPKTCTGCRKRCWQPPGRLSALGGVEFDQVLQLGGIARDGAALVSLDVAVGTAVAEHEAGRGQGRGVNANLAAQGAHAPQPRQQRRAGLLLQVHGWRGSGQRCQGLDGLLVLRGVPPVQELEEEHADGQAGGQGEGNATQSLPQGRLHS